MEATKGTSAGVSSLEELRQGFEHWRAGRRQGERIPEVMWTQAVRETKTQGVYRVARALRLDYAMLKRRAACTAQGGAKSRVAPRSRATRFVEVFAPTAATAPSTSLPSGRAECVVVMENVRGATMRVELNAAGLSGLAGMCSAFWSA